MEERSGFLKAMKKSAGALTAFVSFAVFFFGMASLSPEGIFLGLLGAVAFCIGLHWLEVLDLDRLWSRRTCGADDARTRATNAQRLQLPEERDPEFRLRRLEGLKESALLTDEEYREKRAEILQEL